MSDISKTIRDKGFVSFYCQVSDTGSVGWASSYYNVEDTFNDVFAIGKIFAAMRRIFSNFLISLWFSFDISIPDQGYSRSV